jgi:hypothetical protein
MSAGPWNVFDGVKLIASLQPIAEKYGYTIAIGGRVVEGKETTGALRLFGIPFYHNKTDKGGLLRKLNELWGEYDSVNALSGPEPEPQPQVVMDEPAMPQPGVLRREPRTARGGRLVRDPRPGPHQGQWVAEAQIQQPPAQPIGDFGVFVAQNNFWGAAIPVAVNPGEVIAMDAPELLAMPDVPQLSNKTGRCIYQQSVRFYRDNETIDIHFLG